MDTTAQGISGPDSENNRLEEAAAVMLLTRASILLSLFVLATSSLPGADPTGMIVGTVTDPAGRVVPGSRVSIRNQETSAAREVQSTRSGDYSAPLLPPGLYEVTVEAPNFRRAIMRDVELAVGQTVRVDVRLELGELAQEVTVTATPPLIQTDTSTIGHVVDHQKVIELPLNERNFLLFTLLVPGAQTAAEGSQNSVLGVSVSVNGAREQSNNFLLDGVDNNDLAINHYAVLPSVDAIEEFQVQASNSSAEFGRSGGAQINVVMKSGTNDWHGSLFWFVRNRHLDAKNFFDQPDCTPASVAGTCGEIPRFDRNQFGSVLGGPIRRDQSFFFVSYEGLRLRQANTREATVPSQAQRATVLAAVPTAERNPAGLAMLNLFPRANVGPDLSTSNRYVAAPILRNKISQFLVKLNHNFRSNDLISGHYVFFDEDRFNPYDPFFAFTSLPGFGSNSQNRGQNTGIAWTHVLSPRLVNVARLGFNRLRGRIFQENFGVNISKQLGFPEPPNKRIDLGHPNVLVAGFDGIGEPINQPQQRSDNTFHIVDTVAWNPALQSGRHQFKMGADIRRVQMNVFLDFLARGQWQFLGASSGNPLEDLLRGSPAFAIAVHGDTDTAMRTTNANFFFQDDIHVHPRFTLNLGVRYEYNNPPVEIRDRLSTPDLSPNSLACSPRPDCQFIRAGTNGVPRALFKPDKNNFAPRVGFAWRPKASQRLVLRSAYGIFYDLGILNPYFLPHFNPPFFNTLLFPNTGTSTIQTILSQPALNVQPLPFVTSSDYRDPYMQHWNFDAQYEVMPKFVLLDLAYVGSKGTRLIERRNPNQPRPGGVSPYPQFGSWQFTESGASSIYHALQFRAEMQWSRGLVFLTSYTWSKAIDNASAWVGAAGEPTFPQDSFDLRAERGLSVFHTDRRLEISSLYELPSRTRPYRGSKLLSYILENWSVSGVFSAQSGRPFTVNRTIDQSGTGTFLIAPSDRPDQIADPFRPGPVLSNPDPACHITVSRGGRAADVVRDPASWFNPCAFAAAPGRFGSAGRNSLIGPGLVNLDLSLSKSIPLRGEKRRLQFRFELFNLLNHPNFDIPDRIFDSPTFGQVRSANLNGMKPPRQIQLALKYIF